MDTPGSVPLSGRRAQAARNDQVILDAAREVFLADPEAPISAVANKAGVGISALYRRYDSKGDLLRQLCADGLVRYIRAAETAVRDDGDPWAALVRFMTQVVEEDTHSLTLRLTGTFTPSEELYAEAERAHQLNERIFDRARASGVIRSDLTVNDLSFVFEQIAAVRMSDKERTGELRHRYLALFLDALRAPSTDPLPGPAPSWDEIRARWSQSAGKAEPEGH